MLLFFAKLVIMGSQQPTVINYPSMQRCLAAKAAIERQAEERAKAERAKGILTIGLPVVYCVPD